MWRYLDNHIGSWQINSCITHCWKEYSVDFIRMLEVVQDSHPFIVRNLSIYKWLFKFLCVELQCIYIIWKYDDFISSALMQVDQVLTWQELIWIIYVQWLLSARSSSEVLIIKEGGHLAPNLNALNSCQEPLFLKIQPVGFIKLRSNKEIEVFNSFILSYKCSS